MRRKKRNKAGSPRLPNKRQQIALILQLAVSIYQLLQSGISAALILCSFILAFLLLEEE